MIQWQTEVNRALRRAGFEKELTYSECIDFVIHLYRDCGMSFVRIEQEIFNNTISRTGIRNLLIAEGISFRKRGGANHLQRVDVPVCDLASMTANECARKHHISPFTIYKRRYEHGLKGKMPQLQAADASSVDAESE